jgi:HAD superfamily hydrolase (TIGR01549 family)
MSSCNFGIIFDLDQTLIDSTCVKLQRDNHQWSKVFHNIKKVKPYPGISELLSKLNSNNIKIGVVTSTPRNYCESIIKQNNWVVDTVVGYHDTTQHKPHPEPILYGLKKICVSTENALSIGDMKRDIIASKNAGVTSVGVTWGCENIDELISSSPDKICNSVAELADLIWSIHSAS